MFLFRAGDVWPLSFSTTHGGFIPLPSFMPLPLTAGGKYDMFSSLVGGFFIFLDFLISVWDHVPNSLFICLSDMSSGIPDPLHGFTDRCSNSLRIVYEYCAKTMGQSFNPDDLFTYSEEQVCVYPPHL